MKRFLFFIIISILSSYYSKSQVRFNNILPSWGQESKESKNTTVNKIIGHDGTGYYILKQKESDVGSFIKSSFVDPQLFSKNRRKGQYGTKKPFDFIIEHYNNDLIQTNANEISEKLRNKNGIVEFVTLIGNEIYMFWSIENYRNKKCLYVNEISKSKLDISKDQQLLVETKYYSKEQQYYFEISEDGSKLLVCYDVPYGEGEKLRIGVAVFDINLKPLWNDILILPHKENLIDISLLNIDNSGNVYFTAALYETPSLKKKKIFNYDVTILKYADNGQKLIEYPLDIDGCLITDSRIKVNSGNNIICSGYCAVRNKNIKKTGSFYVNINCLTKKNVTEHVNWIGKDVVIKYKNTGKTYHTDDFNCNLIEFRLLKDSSSLSIGEYEFMATEINSNGTYIYYYHYSDIYLVKRDPKGEIEWAGIIRKDQETRGDGGNYSSYICVESGDKFYFIFNDNPNNIEIKENRPPKKFYGYNNSIIMIIEVDNEGTQKRDVLSYVKESGVFARPNVSKQISSNETIIVGRKRTTQRFGRIEIE